MTSMFDFAATGLFVAAACLFLYRLQNENPPLSPYLAIVGTCALANWTGDNGAVYPALALLVAAGFLMVHLASQPFDEDEA